MVEHVPHLKTSKQCSLSDFYRIGCGFEQAKGQSLVTTAFFAIQNCYSISWSHQSLWNESKVVSKELMKHKSSPEDN